MQVTRTKKERRYEHIYTMYENKLDSMYFDFAIDGDIDVELGIGGSCDIGGVYFDSVSYRLDEWRDAIKELERDVSNQCSNTSTWNFEVIVSYNNGFEYRYGTNLESYGYDYRDDEREKSKEKLLDEVVSDHMLYNAW